jgi:DNA-binding CsgD family transcriptional regulator
MTLVERDKEFAVLEDALAGSLTGSGEMVVVSGAVATGKTVLLHSFVERAVEAGALLLTAVASRAERALPRGVMSQLFRGVDLPGVNGERVSRLLDVGAFSAIQADDGFASGVGTETLPPALLALCDELLDLAASRPVVILIDDLQYADTLSLQWVQYLARRLGSVSLMLVVADCSRPLQANAHFHAEIIRQAYCRRLSLRLLSQHGVAEMLAKHHGDRVEAGVASAYYAVSGGNALLLRALIDDQRGVVATASAEPITGDAYQQAVTNCLLRSEATVLQIAKALAVLDTPGSSALMGRLVGLNAHSADQAMKALAATGLVDTGRFRHQDMRRAVLDGMPPEERSALHGTAAGLLYEEGASTKAVARHLIPMDSAELRRMNAPWCLPVLREVGELALLGGEVNLAISCLRKAYQACTEEDKRVAIAAALSRAEWRVDPSTVVRHLPLLVSALGEGRLTGRQAIEPIGYLLWFGRAREAAEALARLRKTNTALDPDAAADLEVMSLGLSWCYPGFSDRGLQDMTSLSVSSVSSLSLRSKLRAVALLSKVLANDVNDVNDDTLAGAEQILQGVRLDQAAMVPVTATLAALIYADRQKNAASWCERLLTETTGQQAPMARAVCAAIQAVISVRLGDLPAAERLAGSALKLVPPASWGVLIGVPLSALLAATTAMGRHADAGVYLDIPVPEAMFQTPSGLHYLEARGLYHLAGDRLHAALADFQLCGSLMSAWKLDLPTLVPWRAHSATVAFKLGRTWEARKLVREQLSMLGGANSRAVGTSLRVLAEVSEPERRPALLREAVKTLQECGDRLELAQALAALDRALRENGRPGESGGLRRRALDLAKECGAEPLRRTLLGDAGADAPQPSSRAYAAAALSRSEWRVVALAAEGHTNRQIATKLYITVSTVEQHLTKAYRKLDVNRRSDLPRWLRNSTFGHPGKGLASS